MSAEISELEAPRSKSDVTPASATGTGRTRSLSAAIKWVPTQRAWSPLVRYGAAVLFVAIALVITLAAQPYLTRIIFVFFWPAVVGAAMLGGVGPGLAPGRPTAPAP